MTEIESSGSTAVRTLTIRERLDQYLPIVVMSTALASFGAGIFTYTTLLQMTNQETVVKGTVVAKKDLVGPLLNKTVKLKIEALIQQGENVQDDPAKATVWLMRVLAFIHTLKLDKDTEWRENPTAPIQKVPSIESDVRYALRDPIIRLQAQKTLGVLLGFKDGLESIE